jgi:transcriptional regulator with XRE-family HTH domain
MKVHLEIATDASDLGQLFMLAGRKATIDGDSDEKGSRRANPIDVHVGSRVRLRRMLLGISQEKLGERLGLTFQQVQKYEKGVNRIGASRLFDLATVLGVPISFFYEDAPSAVARVQPVPGFAEAPPADSSILEFLSTREGLELNKAFARIHDPKSRRAILDLVRSLAGVDTEESGLSDGADHR